MYTKSEGNWGFKKQNNKMNAYAPEPSMNRKKKKRKKFLQGRKKEKAKKNKEHTDVSNISFSFLQ